MIWERMKTKLRKLSFLKRNYRKVKKLKESFFDTIYFFYYKISGKQIFFSHYARVNNFGDRFNKDLMLFFNFKLLFVNDYRKSYASLTGSILHMYGKNFEGYILGSGFIKESVSRPENRWKTPLLRGPLSKEQCNGMNNCSFGDPGILASLIFKKSNEKKYELGIIPHDIDLNYVRLLKFNSKTKIINVRRSASKVAKEIQECNFIASSSLHGLIFADSFMIPSIHLKFGNRLIGGNHKFKDYYLGMNSIHEFVEFKTQMTMEDIISKCKMRFTPIFIKDKQKEIINIYSNTIDEIMINK